MSNDFEQITFTGMMNALNKPQTSWAFKSILTPCQCWRLASQVSLVWRCTLSPPGEAQVRCWDHCRAAPQTASPPTGQYRMTCPNKQYHTTWQLVYVCIHSSIHACGNDINNNFFIIKYLRNWWQKLHILYINLVNSTYQHLYKTSICGINEKTDNSP